MSQTLIPATPSPVVVEPPLDADALAPRVDEAVEHAIEALWAKRRGEQTQPEHLAWGDELLKTADPRDRRAGDHWCAELEGDSILSSEYLLMKFALGQEDGAGVLGKAAPDGRAVLERVAKHLRMTQRGDGGWGMFPGSGVDISATVKAYLALKLMGDDFNEAHMVAAREMTLAMGGAERINTFSAFYLACLGQVSWRATPAIPPQIVFLPRWAPFHLDKVSAWTRTMILPLAVCSALQPVRELPREMHIDELFVDPRERHRLSKRADRDDPGGWTNIFLGIDRAMKAVRSAGFTPGRRAALRACERWLLARMDEGTTEGLGAIFPPMVYAQVAFRALGYERSHPVLREAERQLDAFIIDAPSDDPAHDHARIQPCFSPVWDTGIALYALTEAGVTARTDERAARVADWLRSQRVPMNGDWVRNLRPEDKKLARDGALSTWSFEYRNDWYPDCDDTAMIAKALKKLGDRPGQRVNDEAADGAVAWLIAMQNDDGGWAAFDRTRPRDWMEAIPFADHNAMQDPSCPDITGRCVEALTRCGVPSHHPTIQRAVRYVIEHQRADGAWIGRWGVNAVYGTWQALGGLHYAGLTMDIEPVRRAGAWLERVQHADGGFGESAMSYEDDSHIGIGPATASQTAWGLMSLLQVFGPRRVSTVRAAQWLVNDQLATDKAPFDVAQTVGGKAVGEGAAAGERAFAGDDAVPWADADAGWVRDKAGSWAERWYTGTGFPKVFYLRYHMYRHTMPLMALARWRAAMRRDN